MYATKKFDVTENLENFCEGVIFLSSDVRLERSERRGRGETSNSNADLIMHGNCNPD